MKYLSDLNLISFLFLIKNEKVSELQAVTSQYPEIIKILKILDVISVLGSDSNNDFALTPLGQSILSNFELKDALSNQDSLLQGISSDIQRIKSSLSAISFDIIRSQGTGQLISPSSDFLFQHNTDVKDIPSKSADSKITSKDISSQNIEELRLYIEDKITNLSPESLNTLKKNLQRIKTTFSKVNNLIHEKKYEEFGLESFILLDGMLIFLLKFFDQQDPAVISLSLEEKRKILKDLPLELDSQLMQFLDRINNDVQTNASEKLKVGEKTATKMFALIHTIYESFVTIFQT